MARLFNEKYYDDAADEDEQEIEANKGIDLKLLQDKVEEVEADNHDYLDAGDKAQQDFEDKMGKNVAEKAQETA